MEKFIKFFFLICCFGMLVGCGKKEELQEKDDRGLYFITTNINRSIYSDEEDPKFIVYDKVESIKEVLPSLNCTYDCIHKNSEPIDVVNDGGSKIYQYEIEGETYYLVDCNRLNSNYHNGKDVLIGKDYNKLVNLC